jgi:hypothetical protein
LKKGFFTHFRLNMDVPGWDELFFVEGWEEFISKPED